MTSERDDFTGDDNIDDVSAYLNMTSPDDDKDIWKKLGYKNFEEWDKAHRRPPPEGYKSWVEYYHKNPKVFHDFESPKVKQMYSHREKSLRAPSILPSRPTRPTPLETTHVIHKPRSAIHAQPMSEPDIKQISAPSGESYEEKKIRSMDAKAAVVRRQREEEEKRYLKSLRIREAREQIKRDKAEMIRMRRERKQIKYTPIYTAGKTVKTASKKLLEQQKKTKKGQSQKKPSKKKKQYYYKIINGKRVRCKMPKKRTVKKTKRKKIEKGLFS